MEAILSAEKRDGTTLFEVKWEGFDETTWEPRSSLVDSDGVANEALLAFEAAQAASLF